MALIKFFTAIALIGVMTFHSMAQADMYSEQNETIDNVIVHSVNKWCDMKMDSSTSSIESVQYCKAIQNEFPDCFISDHQCSAINQGSGDDMAELSQFVAQYLIIEFDDAEY